MHLSPEGGFIGHQLIAPCAYSVYKSVRCLSRLCDILACSSSALSQAQPVRYRCALSERSLLSHMS